MKLAPAGVFQIFFILLAPGLAVRVPFVTLRALVDRALLRDMRVF